MYITKIVIDNIRCFKHIEIDLSSQQGAKMWTLLLGDNGVGKTTILRCIAMTLIDSTSASALLRELYGEWVRDHQDKQAKNCVRIEFDNKSKDGQSWFIKTSFEKMESGDSKVTQETYPVEFPWDDIFVCGYGAARRAYGSKDYSEYSPIDSVYTLFNYDSPLQNPELILRKIEDIGVSRKEIFVWLDKILMLPEGSTKMNGLEGIMMNDFSGKNRPLTTFGDGHQATLAWIVDMIGWVAFYYESELKDLNNKFSGIVLLDEIEHHLHPSWQKKIIKLLSEQFPNLQFITTTHAPLCAIGCANLSDDACSLVLLTQEDDHVTGRDKLRPPHGRRADQVLSSYLFGLDTTRSDDSAQRIERYSKLLSKKNLTGKEQEELRGLRSQLNEELGSGETELQRLVEKAVHESLKKLVADLPNQEELPQEAIDLEVKRKLKDLLDKKA